MKKLLGAGLLALFCAAPAKAGCWPPFKVECGGNFYIRCYSGTACGGVLGPWYNYWPLEAHFITPAPTGYPYWPQPQALPPNPVLPPPQPNPKPGAAPDVKPASYSPYYPPVYYGQPGIYYGPAPSYWYSRP